jgi:hypothetical protein
MLAHRADAAVFGAGRPSDEDVEAYWAAVDRSISSMREGLGFWQRQRTRFSPRSLLIEARLVLAARRAPRVPRPRLRTGGSLARGRRRGEGGSE